MKRSHFFILAALVPGTFGLVMMVAPEAMLTNSLALPVDTPTKVVTQWVGFGVFSLAWINYLSRNDPGSAALKAVMLGNVLFHVLGIGVDFYDYLSGFMKLSGFVTGLVPHGLIAGGFIYYLLRFPGRGRDAA